MRKLVNRVRKVNAQVVGLDIHQDLIAYRLPDRQGNEIESGEVGGRPFELEALQDRCIGRKKSHVAFEASGSSYRVFDLLCSRYGRERVHVGHAGKIRAIANSKEKNNANDAFWVAYLTHEGRLPEANIPEAAIRELRIATRERIRAVRRHSDLVRRLRSHVRQMGESFPTRGVDTVAAQEFLGQLLSRTGGSRGMAIRHVLEEMASRRCVYGECFDAAKPFGGKKDTAQEGRRRSRKEEEERTSENESDQEAAGPRGQRWRKPPRRATGITGRPLSDGDPASALHNMGHRARRHDWLRADSSPPAPGRKCLRKHRTRKRVRSRG